MSRPVLLGLRALGLGDLLTALPALRALQRAFPEHRRLLAAPLVFAPLLELAGVDVEVVDTAGLRGVEHASRHPDVAVNLHGRGPQSHLVLLELAPRRLIAFSNRDVPAGGPEWQAGEHEMERWCRLLTESGVPADPVDFRIALPPVPEGPAPVVLHPGAKDPARRWPVERWATVAEWLAGRGLPVVISGSTAERRLAGRVAAAAGLPVAAVMAGRTSLVELAGMVGAAMLVVCGDTGAAHLATALGTPSVVLFGPTPPSEWGPPPGGPHTVLWAGRRGDPHASEPDPGLLAIDPVAVTMAVDARLRDLARASATSGRCASAG